jgi:ABC-type molybdenum transport system ATPase subunit/photorepair protein PhrA
MDQAGRRPASAEPRPFISVEGARVRQGSGEPGPAIWWQILADQHWAVIGPNGCGKSMLMRQLSGRMATQGGRIVYHFLEDGAASNGSTARARTPREEIAYVDFRLRASFLNREAPYYQARWNSLGRQDAPLVSEYLSEEAVKRICPYQVAGSRLDPARFQADREQVARLLGIEPLLDRRLVQISSGERRRVLLARALLQKPRLCSSWTTPLPDWTRHSGPSCARSSNG